MRKPFDGNYVITQGYGENPNSYNYSCMPDKSHNGIDWGTPTGTRILAVEEGTVIRADTDSTGYGIHVRIKNPAGGGTIYGHLSRLKVSVGQDVKAGDLIGFSGNTGNSTGPHLHFEYRVIMEDCTTTINPLPLLDEDSDDNNEGMELPDLDENEAIVNTDYLNVRLEPNGRIIGGLLKDDKIKLCNDYNEIEKDGYTWQPIVVYVAKEYLR